MPDLPPDACCTFHASGGSPDLSCGGDLPHDPTLRRDPTPQGAPRISREVHRDDGVSIILGGPTAEPHLHITELDDATLRYIKLEHIFELKRTDDGFTTIIVFGVSGARTTIKLDDDAEIHVVRRAHP